MNNTDIKNLWEDENFIGSYSGLSNFQKALFTTFGESIGIKRLQSILQDIPSYVSRIKPKNKFPQRPYDVYGFGQLLQADLGVMFKFEGFYYFLLVIDVFSRRIFTKPLRNKQILTVKEAFKTILEQITNRIEVIQTDSGAEFKGLRPFFDEQDIRHQYKYGKTKCNFAESAIFIIKLKLYSALRSNNSRDWPYFLMKVVHNYNETPKSYINNLKPNDFQSSLDDVKIPWRPKEPDFEDQFENQKEYESNLQLPQVGTFCFLQQHLRTDVFQKSFDLMPGQLFRIRRVLAGFKPYLYQLENLKGRPKDGYYYRQQLILRKEGPQPGKFFQVEKILGKRKHQGKVQYYVKYLHYENDFNTWVNEEDLFDD
jgi:Integrase core domain/Chromo (CHRromatin Organisation MOdifier) domain